MPTADQALARDTDRAPPHPARRRDVVRSGRVLALSLAAVALAAIVFAVRPDLDLWAAGRFWSATGGFVGDTPAGRATRHLCEALPFAIFAAMAGLSLLRRVAGPRIWAPRGAGLVMMAASLALGPGLLVNTLLKEHSHRPRPAQVAAFGGPDTFRPFYRFDGACTRNCSFVSGEGALAFWTLAPALLAPPPFRLAAVAAALIFGAVTSLLRMAFGGHFLSDSIFAGLFVWLVILACWHAVARWSGGPPRAEG